MTGNAASTQSSQQAPFQTTSRFDDNPSRRHRAEPQDQRRESLIIIGHGERFASRLNYEVQLGFRNINPHTDRRRVHRLLLGDARPCRHAGWLAQATVRACGLGNATTGLGYGLIGPEAYRSVTFQESHVPQFQDTRRTLRYVEPLSEARTPLADFFSILLGDVCIALTAGRVEHGLLHRQGLAWNAVLLHGPCAQVSDLATFRAEGTPRISFPRCGLLTQGTGHGVECNGDGGERKVLAERLSGVVTIGGWRHGAAVAIGFDRGR